MSLPSTLIVVDVADPHGSKLDMTRSITKARKLDDIAAKD